MRKINYSRERQVVEWLSYKPGARRARFTPQQFQEGLTEYQVRLGAFGHEDRQELHRAYGHLSKPRIRETERLMGGEPLPHGKTCPCSECGDWDRLMPDEIDAIMASRSNSGR